MISIYVIIGVFALLSWIVSNTLKSKFKKFSQIPVNYGLTGRDIAEKMLADSGIYDVKVLSVEGELTDHYNPAKKTVNLSRDVYYGNNVAAAAVAAHECGHAIQHARAYAWLTMRSSLVPVVSISSKWMMWVIVAGAVMLDSFPQLMLVGIVMYAMTTLFSFITLPVEVNASQRALSWLTNAGVTSYANYPQAKEALKWAAYTYVVAALASLATLIYYIMLFMGRRN